MLLLLIGDYYDRLRAEMDEIESQLEYKKSTLLVSVNALQNEMKDYLSELGLSDSFIM